MEGIYFCYRGQLKKLARIEVELASLGVNCNLEVGFLLTHADEEGNHAVYEIPALLLSRPACVLI